MSTATLSPCGQYRYRLTRQWGPGPSAAVFIMLNPSTADASNDDPTIRRCIGYAKDWGHDGLIVANLYAFRATKPVDLWRTPDPVGPDNDWELHDVFFYARMYGRPVVAAWGANAKPERVAEVVELAHISGEVPLTALGVTKDGAPRHPLYMPKTATPTPWEMTA